MDIMESPKVTQESMVGRRLAEDPWFAYNTLPFILRFLDVRDLLRSARVCKMWQQVVKDPVFWRFVKIVDSVVDFPMMTKALDGLNTVHLSLRSSYCEFIMSRSNKCSAISKMQELRILEMDRCTIQVLETLTTLNPNLEVIKVSIILSKPVMQISDLKLFKFDLSFVSRMPKLYELKLNGYGKLQGFQEFLATLNLKHLYLFDFDDVHDFPRYKWSKNTTLETLGLGYCFNLSQFVPFLRSLTALKKLCLDYCWKWDSFEILKCISEMNSINCLELFVVDIDDPNFEKGLKLCSNLKELTIRTMGPFHERFNAKVALEPLKYTLKKSKWGYWGRYEVDRSFLHELKTVLPFTDVIATDERVNDIFN